MSDEYTEIYCNNCKKTLGRYNERFYNEDTIREMLRTVHSVHVKEGHAITIKKLRRDGVGGRPLPVGGGAGGGGGAKKRPDGGRGMPQA